jgi:choline kinase
LLFQLNMFAVKKVYIVVGFARQKVYIAVKKELYKYDIELIENDLYEEDINIYSLLLAVKRCSRGYLIIEGDIIFKNEAVDTMLKLDPYRSVWYTSGKFEDHMYGGILKADDQGKLVDLRIVKEYKEEYKDYKKLIGATKVSDDNADRYKNLLSGYADKTIKQYYLQPWIDNLKQLPCYERDLGGSSAFSFNTVSAFEGAKSNMEDW